jgi:hypothetical protein
VLTDASAAFAQPEVLSRSPEGAYADVPPLRPPGMSASDIDSQDGRRIAWVREKWEGQDNLLRARDRQVEENVRMLCGQQWTLWSNLLGQFVDLTQLYTDEERRWRLLPVLNRLLLWFMLTHARMTENPPVITFQAGSDRKDAQLAETMDVIWKYVWRQAGMLDVIDHVVSHLIPGGRAYWKTRVDPNVGEMKTFSGPAVLQLLYADGQPATDPTGQPIHRVVQDAPYAADGQPAVQWVTDGTGERIVPRAAPFKAREGGIVVDPISCLEVRGQWGSTPWPAKRWHMHRAYLTPEEVYQLHGVWIKPEIVGVDAENVGALQRLLMGAGFFGAAGGWQDATDALPQDARVAGYVDVMEYWEKPCDFPGMQESDGQPGGRLSIVTRSRVLYDGPRYAAFKYTSPIRAVDFVKLPGRPHGTSPQEMLNGPQRSYNRLAKQVLAHTDLVSNPIKILDRETGLQEGQVKSKPGLTLTATLRPGVRPVEYVSPPPLGSDVYKGLDLLRIEMNELGNISGAEGRAPTPDPSGELVKELRFNSDRFIGPTMRRFVTEIARWAEDVQAIIPVLWDRNKVITIAGEDGVAQTVTVLPEMFVEGTVHVVPDVESMLPEGRGERQARVLQFYQLGLYGPPGTPEAVGRFFDLGNYPNMNRAMRPGGVDFTTAEQENGEFVAGQTLSPPVLPWYDHAVHITVHEKFMKSREFLKLAPVVQQAFAMHRQAHMAAAAQAAASQLAGRADVAQQLAPPQPGELPGAQGPQPDQGPPVAPGPPPIGPTAVGGLRTIPRIGPTANIGG